MHYLVGTPGNGTYCDSIRCHGEQFIHTVDQAVLDLPIVKQ